MSASDDFDNMDITAKLSDLCMKVNCGKGTSHFVFTDLSPCKGWNRDSFFLAEKDLRKQWWRIKPGQVVIDIGAGFGSYALAALARGASLVVAFEPSRDMIFDLCMNHAMNRFEGKLIVVPLMASEMSCHLGAYFPETNSAVLQEGVEEVRLLVRVDDYLKHIALHKVDWIKIDVEGLELCVIEGAMKTIEKFRPNIIVECHESYAPGITAQVEEMLLPFGYKVKEGSGIGDNDVWRLFHGVN